MLQNSFKNPLESFKGLQSFADNLGAKAKTDSKSESEFKIFQNAMMVLAAPNSIAVTTNENVYLSADKHIYETASDSIQYSTQKSLITHAQNKISLFAAQEGARLYAAKGKVEIQAQGDAADLIARKGVQVISTEDKIEIKASKKIVLIAGGSQIEISSSGVLPTTSGKFEAKAGQHNFVGGGSINVSLPYLPENQVQKYGVWFDVMDKSGKKLPVGTEYIIFDENRLEVKRGKLDKTGLVKLETEEPNKTYKIHVVIS